MPYETNQQIAQSLRNLADQIESSPEKWFREDSNRFDPTVNDVGEPDVMVTGTLVGVTNLPDVAEVLRQPNKSQFPWH